MTLQARCMGCGGELDTGTNCARRCNAFLNSRLGAPRELSPGEERSLERTAELVAEVGRLRNVIRDAIDNLPEGFAARDILQRALSERDTPEQP